MHLFFPDEPFYEGKRYCEVHDDNTDWYAEFVDADFKKNVIRFFIYCDICHKEHDALGIREKTIGFMITITLDDYLKHYVFNAPEEEN